MQRIKHLHAIYSNPLRGLKENYTMNINAELLPIERQIAKNMLTSDDVDISIKDALVDASIDAADAASIDAADDAPIDTPELKTYISVRIV